MRNSIEVGRGVTQDYAEAAKWYRLAATQGDANSQVFLGLMYSRGQGVTRDYEEAVKWYRLSAAQEDSLAQWYLGTMYANGQGVTQDYAEAIKWYRLAASRGAAEPENSLGMMYYTGKGVTQNYAEAITWFGLAAAKGYAEAQYNLGTMYANGQGVAKDLNEAQRLLQLAANQNVEGAANLLAGVQRQLALAHVPKAMSVEDFLLDADQLDGRDVAVQGVAWCIGPAICFLTQSAQNMTFDPTALPREDRRKLLECQLLVTHCLATVFGRADAGGMVPKVDARRVEWE